MELRTLQSWFDFGIPYVLIATTGILALGYLLKMAWVATRRVSTKVVNFHPFSDGSNQKLVDGTVGLDNLADLTPDTAVASGVSEAGEVPASSTIVPFQLLSEPEQQRLSGSTSPVASIATEPLVVLCAVAVAFIGSITSILKALRLSLPGSQSIGVASSLPSGIVHMAPSTSHSWFFAIINKTSFYHIGRIT